MSKFFGHTGKVLRVDLTAGTQRDEALDEQTLSRSVGGTGLGVKYLYEEVPPEAAWSDPVNRLVIASGPIGGTSFSGSGTVSVVCKGAMTNMTAATQANGFLGAFMKLRGYDAIVIQGVASDWTYLHLTDEGVELRDARFLVGKDTWQIEDAITEVHPGRKYSVFGIGPAGEHLVHFAAIVGDRGHVAGHNGVGAVMGSKKLKAIAIARATGSVPVFDPAALRAASDRAFKLALEHPIRRVSYDYGTAGHFSMVHAGGLLPVKNYTTNVFPDHEKVSGIYTREHFENKKLPCWACRIVCCRMTTVTQGPYTGYVGEEPEYEGYAACSSQIGQSDAGSVVMLGNLVDRLGFDINEAGWVMGFAIECFERGLLSEADVDGLELRWGNVEAVANLLRKIAHREGIGELFAEGVRGAAQKLGGEALSVGVYTKVGNSPRGHDHRAHWEELLDTCVGNTGTIECSQPSIDLRPMGIEPAADKFSWQEVAAANARVNGWRQWSDCLGVCHSNFVHPAVVMDAYNAATGRQLGAADAHTIGRRIVNLMRVYNVRCGLTPALEEPSARYSSTPVDGPAAGITIREHWPAIRRSYYEAMGWDKETGRPKPETVRALGLDEL